MRFLTQSTFALLIALCPVVAQRQLAGEWLSKDAAQGLVNAFRGKAHVPDAHIDFDLKTLSPARHDPDLDLAVNSATQTFTPEQRSSLSKVNVTQLQQILNSAPRPAPIRLQQIAPDLTAVSVPSSSNVRVYRTSTLAGILANGLGSNSSSSDDPKSK